MSQVAITIRDFIEQNQDIIGSGPDDVCSYNHVNKARVIAYTTGDVVGSIGYSIIPVYGNGLFLLDSKYEAIREVRNCMNRANISSGVRADIMAFDYTSCAGSALVARIHGREYCPVQLTENCDLYFACLNDNDNDTPIIVHYTDTRGTTRREQVLIPHFSRGVIGLQYEPSKITKIQKPITKGRIVIHTSSEEAFLEPNELIPSYSIYAVAGDSCNVYSQGSMGCSGPVFVKAKKRCIPITIDGADDILDINPEALCSLIIAVKARSDRAVNWVKDYTEALRLGVDFLKAEMINEQDTSRGMEPINMDNTFFDDVTYTADMLSGNGCFSP